MMPTPFKFLKLSKVLLKKSRKIIALIVTGLLLCSPITSVAELLTGTVQFVDEKRSRIIMLPVSPTQSADTETELPAKVVIEVTDEYVPRGGPGHVFPGCVQPGKTIRVWGNFSDRDDGDDRPQNNLFLATDIRGPGNHFFHDPTGVRSRLGNDSRFGRFKKNGRRQNGGGNR